MCRSMLRHIFKWSCNFCIPSLEKLILPERGEDSCAARNSPRLTAVRLQVESHYSFPSCKTRDSTLDQFFQPSGYLFISKEIKLLNPGAIVVQAFFKALDEVFGLGNIQEILPEPRLGQKMGIE